MFHFVYVNVIENNICLNYVYMPNKQLSLDEGMVPWRELLFRVYNPDKSKGQNQSLHVV